MDVKKHYLQIAAISCQACFSSENPSISALYKITAARNLTDYCAADGFTDSSASQVLDICLERCERKEKAHIKKFSDRL